MSELEDPVVTLLRLISSQIRVAKDNGGLAKILSSEQSLDRELLLKEVDAQITVGIDPNLGIQDQKLELAGRLRRRTFNFKCVSYSIDKPSTPGADSGRVMRKKIAEQMNTIIRENRKQPNQTPYNFYGLGYPTGDPHKAYAAGAFPELAPSNDSWTELSSLEYQSIWASDDVHYFKNHSVEGEYSMMLFGFKIASRPHCIKKLIVRFEGYGTAPVSNGITVKLWNHTTSVWQHNLSGNDNQDQTLTITITANWTDNIDSNGYVWLLAKTTNPSNGVEPTVLNCDYVQCVAQVLGITYCDIVSYKPVDAMDVKPFIFKTEFSLKGWLFETVSG